MTAQFAAAESTLSVQEITVSPQQQRYVCQGLAHVSVMTVSSLEKQLVIGLRPPHRTVFIAHLLRQNGAQAPGRFSGFVGNDEEITWREISDHEAWLGHRQRHQTRVQHCTISASNSTLQPFQAA